MQRKRTRGRDPLEKYEVEDRGFSSPCWIWQGWVPNGRYGRVRVNGTSVSAQRYVYERLVGELRDGETLDHLCRETLCVNPAHLEPVTCAENNRRNGKLTMDDARAIRTRRAAGERPSDLADEYGVSRNTVSHVLHHRTWREAA